MVLENNRAVRVIEDRGRRQGILQGIQQGIERTAQNMLRRGRSIQEISEDTGLDVTRITELQNNLQTQKAE